MFVSHEKNYGKKRFQKPNILRRKSKVPVIQHEVTESVQSPDVKCLVTTDHVNEPINLHVMEHRMTKKGIANHKVDEGNQININSAQKFISSAVIPNDRTLNSNGVIKRRNTNEIAFTFITPQRHNNQDNVQNAGNTDSLLFGDAVKQNVNAYGKTDLQIQSVDKYVNTKKSLDVSKDSCKLIKKICHESQESNLFLDQKLDVITTMVPLSEVSSMGRKNIITVQGKLVPTINSIPNKAVNDLIKNSAKFKCEIIDCNKEFSNKQKLKKHQNSHNKEGNNRPSRQTSVECPIKALQSGVEEPCGRVFLLREDLLNHLNEDHTLEEANHVCGECGRRFFWASGLRAHGRAHGRARAHGALACAWPGCGRVFRQPCRLREHTRAHTGDKPYPCKFPNCGWSFRTASKLVRHSRRHTGERRHSCTACGRAFLRREHLREHHARQHSPRARPPHACSHPGCEQSFNNMSSLYMHMKKVHKKEETSTSNAVISGAATYVEPNAENTFTVSVLNEPPVQYSAIAKIDVGGDVLIEGVVGVEMSAEVETEVDVEAGVGEMGEEEQRAARTHCTWPLLPRAPCGYEDCGGAFVLEEDVRVEQPESSESNIYTIRSDLFLHGNVLTNEDSESMGGGAAGSLPDELGLLDAHPAADLMQEELMYTDAVDESSFRVFLLSGEELT